MTVKTQVLETYNTLHATPELGFQEKQTSAYLAKKLKEFGYQVKENVGGTGIIGTLNGAEPGPAVGLRGDMDALGHEIDGKLVAIHSCGHDAHSSMVLGAAEVFAKKGVKRGTLQILFQPAEELGTGALRMIEEGAAKDLDMLFGIHLRPIQESRIGQATPALHHGASTTVKVKIEGKTAHGARPHLGINAINAASAIIQAVNGIYIDPAIPTTIKATQIRGGGPATNSIPANAEVVFDARSRRNDTMDELLAKAKIAIEHAAIASGATAHVEICGIIPAAEYNQEMIELAKQAIVDVLGQDGLMDEVITPGGEDFHFFTKKLPNLKTTYLGLGCDLTPGLHDPKMDFNKDALEKGVAVLVALTDKALAL